MAPMPLPDMGTPPQGRRVFGVIRYCEGGGYLVSALFTSERFARFQLKVDPFYDDIEEFTLFEDSPFQEDT